MGQLMSQKWMILSHCSACWRRARCHGYVKFMAAGLFRERKPGWRENERRRHWYRGSDPSGGGVFGKSQLCSVLSLCHLCKAPLKFRSILYGKLSNWSPTSNQNKKQNTEICVKGEGILIKALKLYTNCVMGLVFCVLWSHRDFSCFVCVFTVWRQKSHTRELSLVLDKRSEKCPPLLCCQLGGECYALYRSTGEEVFFLAYQEMLTLQVITEWMKTSH